MKIIAILVWSLVVVTTGAFAQDDAAPPPHGVAPIRVMSFNIRNSAARDGSNHWKFRKETVRDTIGRFNPDVFGVQEVLADQFDYLLAEFADYSAEGVARDDGARAGEWSAIFYRKHRFERLEAGNFWLSEEPTKVGSRSWDAACVRICTWARLKDRSTSKEVLFANTHFDHWGRLAREKSAGLLQERLPQLARGAPVILTGDFNCAETDDAYRTLVAATEGKGLVFFDSYRILHPERSPDEATFHGFKGTTVGSRIDWILHTRELKPVAADIVRVWPGRHPSDHYPITAVFEWRDADHAGVVPHDGINARR